MQSVVDNVFSWKKAELYICKRCGCEYGIDSADTIHFCEVCGGILYPAEDHSSD